MTNESNLCLTDLLDWPLCPAMFGGDCDCDDEPVQNDEERLKWIKQYRTREAQR